MIFNTDCTAIAICRCAMANSAPAIAMSRPARCMASCACAASRRTTATSSARKTSSSSNRRLTSLAMSVYKDFGFNDIVFKLALRPDKRVGTDEIWDRAEQRLRRRAAAPAAGMGGAAGRGRVLRPEDRVPPQGRHRPFLAVRHDAGRLHAAGAARCRIRRGRQHPQAPVMLHRAIVGSHGAVPGHPDRASRRRFPVWLAPVQAVVLNITENQADYARDRGAIVAKTRV